MNGPALASVCTVSCCLCWVISSSVTHPLTRRPMRTVLRQSSGTSGTAKKRISIMRIAIVSDTHSRLATIARTIDLLQKHGVTTVLHCGDIEDPSAVSPFVGLDTHFVFGNCDQDRPRLR